MKKVKNRGKLGKYQAPLDNTSKYFGVYNNINARFIVGGTEKRNQYGGDGWAKQYYEAHKDRVAQMNLSKIYADSEKYAREKFAKKFKVNPNNPMEELKEQTSKLSESVGDIEKSIVAYKGSYAALNKGALTKYLFAVNSNKLSENDLNLAKADFEEVVFGVFSAMNAAVPTKAVIEGFQKIESPTVQDAEKIFNNLDLVSRWLDKSGSDSSATALRNLMTNLQGITKKLDSGHFQWVSGKEQKIGELTPDKYASIGARISRSLMNIQGGISELAMALSISASMKEIDSAIQGLGDFKITGGVKLQGKDVKQDFLIKMMTSNGDLINARFSGKSSPINVGTSPISFETTSQAKNIFTEQTKYAKPFYMFSHIANLGGEGSGNAQSLAAEYSKAIAADHALDAIGIMRGMEFVAFQDDILPSYEVIKRLSEGNLSMYAGVSKGETYYKYLRIQNESREKHSEAFIKEYLKNGKATFSLYQRYVFKYMNEHATSQLKYFMQRN